MSLNSRALALQGFLLTPIAMAVQGLIAVLIEEEKSRVYGKGKARAQPRIHKSDSLTREEVEASWDLLETRLRNQELQHPKQDPAPAGPSSGRLGRIADESTALKAAESEQKHPVVTAVIAQEAINLVANQEEIAAIQRRRQEDEFIMMLCI